MDITPTADDKGLQRLKLEQQDNSVKPTRPVEGYPRIPDSENKPPGPPLPHRERRKEERRSGEERRQHNEHTAYDTRGEPDRRHGLRRRKDRLQASGKQDPVQHIDEEV